MNEPGRFCKQKKVSEKEGNSGMRTKATTEKQKYHISIKRGSFCEEVGRQLKDMSIAKSVI